MRVEGEAVALAIEALSWVDYGAEGATAAFARSVNQLDVRDYAAIGLAHKLMQETLRRRITLDAIISAVVPASVSLKLQIGVKNFLRVFAYLAKFEKPGKVEHAIRYVRLARGILGWTALQPVEAHLGEILTFEVDELKKNRSHDEILALETFHPIWFVNYCRNLLGEDGALELLQCNMHPPPTYIRLNTLQKTEHEIEQALRREGIEITATDSEIPLYVVKRTKTPLVKARAYRRGLFTIQDKSTCLAVEAAEVKPGMTLIEACAAPGTKSSFAAQLMQNDGVIIGLDVSPQRLRTAKTEMRRLKVGVVDFISADASACFPLTARADRVFVDPPCTNTGIFHRDPLSKWIVGRSDIARLSRLQRCILENSANHVVEGGLLLYSTCSVLQEENEDVVTAFLDKHHEFEHADVGGKFSAAIGGAPGCGRLLPTKHACNGFFIAKLRRKRR